MTFQVTTSQVASHGRAATHGLVSAFHCRGMRSPTNCSHSSPNSRQAAYFSHLLDFWLYPPPHPSASPSWPKWCPLRPSPRGASSRRGLLQYFATAALGRALTTSRWPSMLVAQCVSPPASIARGGGSGSRRFSLAQPSPSRFSCSAVAHTARGVRSASARVACSTMSLLPRRLWTLLFPLAIRTWRWPVAPMQRLLVLGLRLLLLCRRPLPISNVFNHLSIFASPSAIPSPLREVSLGRAKSALVIIECKVVMACSVLRIWLSWLARSCASRAQGATRCNPCACSASRRRARPCLAICPLFGRHAQPHHDGGAASPEAALTSWVRSPASILSNSACKLLWPGFCARPRCRAFCPRRFYASSRCGRRACGVLLPGSRHLSPQAIRL